MKTLKKLLFNDWTLTIITAISLALIIYFVGPLISIADSTPLASPLSRWLTMLCIFTIWSILKIYRFIKSQNQESGFLDNLFVKQSDPNEDISKNERETLQRKFKEAVVSLKKSSKITGNKFNFYEIPWYIIIGPPGSGKTTTLVNSGLKFPLAKESGAGAIQGIGGTRNCDWWFTDQGIIIDTAGRYTTQDSDKELDGTAWRNFLQLLKKFRKRRPINGVFVTISIQELLLQTPDQRAQQVAAVSNRLQELRDTFNVEFPVYVLVTKTDLISGFEEYFDSYSKTDLEQVWGITFPLDQDANTVSPLKLFSDEYDHLLQTVNQSLISRLHQERDQLRAEKISSFPKQLHVIKPLLESFLVDVFENSRFSQPLLLRGFYFCSGTQEGTPIDRLMNKLSGTKPPVLAQSKGKSFFIKNLFENIVFKESGLVGTDLRLEKRLRLYRLGAISAIGIASLTTLGGWTSSYLNNTAFIDSASQQIAEANYISSQLPATEVDIPATLPLLNAVRSLPAGYDSPISTSLLMNLGLSQQEKIGESATASYQDILNKVLLSRLMLQTEYSLSESQNDDTYTYAALRTYLMLGSEEHFDSEEVSSFYRLSWLQPLARSLSPEQYQQLSSHIDVLFRQRPVPLPIALDAELIEKAQLQLASTPLERTIYSRLQQLDLEQLPAFTVYDNAGQQRANQVFVRKSGLALTEGVEALYTKQAYQRIMNNEIENLTNEVIDESWVYGEGYRHNRNIDEESLISSVKALYQKNYIVQYENLLRDLDIAPFTNYNDAALVLNILSGQVEPSPLQLLVEAIKEQTQFGVVQIDAGLLENSKIKRAQAKLKRILGSSPEIDTSALSQSSDPITQRFAALHRTVTAKTKGQTLPLESALTQFDELYTFMSKVSLISRNGALDSSLIGTGEEKILRVRQTAQSQPPLLIAPFMNSVANRTASLAFGGAMIHINRLWAEESYEYCIGVVENRYPLVKSSSQEISLVDFGDFFGYQGIMDNFFNEHLKDYIDTAKSPWRVYKDQQGLVSISPEALAAFEKANTIRRSFFDRGAKEINTAFKIKPQQLDDGLRGFYLNLDGQSVSYEFGPLITNQLNWPGPQPSSGANFTLKQVNGSDISIYTEGDWAWFRLLDKIQLKRAASNSNYNVKFLTPSGYSASYALTAGGVNNPYRIASRMNFKCPASI